MAAVEFVFGKKEPEELRQWSAVANKVLAKCEEGPAIVYADLDLADVLPMRQAIQVHDQKRSDLYTLKWSGKRGWLW